jgi:hypothetical protein
MDYERSETEFREKAPIRISEGADVYGSDGKHGGRVEAVGAHYLTIAAGMLGQKTFHMPLNFVAYADTDRVELALPLMDAEARAYKGVPPDDEPIYANSEPISPEMRGAVGIPVDRRKNFGL